MKALLSKKGLMSPGEFMMGVLVGIVVGALIIYLAHKGILPIPLP